MTRLTQLLLLCTMACLAVTPVRADQFTPAQRAEIVQIMRDALKKDPTILRDAVSAMQDEDSRQQHAKIASLGSTLASPDDPVGGNPNGDVTIVEFFDTRCPYCRKMEPTMMELLLVQLF